MTTAETGTTQAATAPGLRSLLDGQRAAFRADPRPSAAARRDRLDRLICVLTDSAEELSKALQADFGVRPRGVNYSNDIVGILPDILLNRARLRTWSRPRRVITGALAGMPTFVEPIPKGVVGVIGPWNFPVALVMQPAAAALAAGNRVMIKMSELTPHTAEALARAVARHFDPTELTVVTGGVEVATEFAALPFDHLFFTGSPRVGSLVAQAAARNLTPVTLELGGKNPAMVSPDADLRRAADRIMRARLVNGGQLCLCPDYALVPAGRVTEFVDALMQTTDAIDAAKLSTDLVSIVDQANADRVHALVRDAADKGATVRVADGAPTDDPLGSRRIWPTVLTGVTEQMTIAQDEVFGPVLTVVGYRDLDDAIDYIAGRPTPLAAYWFGPTGRDFDHFRSRTPSGGITVDDFAAHCAMTVAPFGGLGRSGSGSYHGRAGFDTFSHQRTVVRNRLPMSVAAMAAPPYKAVDEERMVRLTAFVGRRAAKRVAAYRVAAYRAARRD